GAGQGGGRGADPGKDRAEAGGGRQEGRTGAAGTLGRGGVQVAGVTIAFGTEDGTVDIGGDLVPVPADRVTLSRIAQQTGGVYHSAASPAELRDVDRDLGRQIGYPPQPPAGTRGVGRGGALARLVRLRVGGVRSH